VSSLGKVEFSIHREYSAEAIQLTLPEGLSLDTGADDLIPVISYDKYATEYIFDLTCKVIAVEGVLRNTRSGYLSCLS